jgi:NAD(P)-dependent dehydrogenase (short-subunit alcohol dehydrogenase family)
MQRTFYGRSVLITGASRGIGRSLALQLSDAGANVGLVARTRADLESVAALCRAKGISAIAVPADVSLVSDCARAVEDVVEYHGGLDMLILNAGISMLARFEDLDDATALERVMQVNYFGAVYCVLHALPALRAARGRIVAVSSLTGLAGVPTRTGYAASKHAMRGFFDSLRIEIARHGISVTVAYPGFVDTGIRERAVGEGPGRPAGRRDGGLMSAEECATRILRAASRRRRQVVMTLKGRVGRWVELVAPGVVDHMAARAVGFDP